MLLDRLLTNTAERLPESTAVIHGNFRITYNELYMKSIRLAGKLKGLGLSSGDRVLIILDNSVEYLVSYFAVLYAGGIVVAISPDTKGFGLTRIVADCKPFGLIANTKIVEILNSIQIADHLKFILIHGLSDDISYGNIPIFPISECYIQENTRIHDSGRDENDLAAIIYTSGTTGEPKGVMLSHKNLYSNTFSNVSYLGISEKDSIMVVLPFYYSYGNSLLLTHVMQGGTLIIDNRFLYPNVILENMVKEKVTGFAGVPSTFAILLYRSNFRNVPLPSLRYITQAGGPMPHNMAIEILKILPYIKLYIMYGQTEASARLSYLPPEDITRKFGSIGKAIPGVTLTVKNEKGVEVKPGEMGEIIASGDNIMRGYWGRAEDTARVIRNGNLYTGDMATIDDEGYIYIRSRKNDIIKSGAHRITPGEIEAVIHDHPKVFDVAVVGQEDTLLGETVCAFVILKEGYICDGKDLLHYCHERLPAYKCPRVIHFMDSFPRTENGKIKKEELKKIYQLNGARL